MKYIFLIIVSMLMLFGCDDSKTKPVIIPRYKLDTLGYNAIVEVSCDTPSCTNCEAKEIAGRKRVIYNFPAGHKVEQMCKDSINDSSNVIIDTIIDEYFATVGFYKDSTNTKYGFDDWRELSKYGEFLSDTSYISIGINDSTSFVLTHSYGSKYFNTLILRIKDGNSNSIYFKDSDGNFNTEKEIPLAPFEQYIESKSTIYTQSSFHENSSFIELLGINGNDTTILSGETKGTEDHLKVIVYDDTKKVLTDLKLYVIDGATPDYVNLLEDSITGVNKLTTYINDSVLLPALSKLSLCSYRRERLNSVYDINKNGVIDTWYDKQLGNNELGNVYYSITNLTKFSEREDSTLNVAIIPEPFRVNFVIDDTLNVGDTDAEFVGADRLVQGQTIILTDGTNSDSLTITSVDKDNSFLMFTPSLNHMYPAGTSYFYIDGAQQGQALNDADTLIHNNLVIVTDNANVNTVSHEIGHYIYSFGHPKEKENIMYGNSYKHNTRYRELLFYGSDNNNEISQWNDIAERYIQ